MKKMKYFLAIVVILVVGLLGSVLVFAGLWQLSHHLGVSFLDHEAVAAIFLLAVLVAMFWAGNKLASFNRWPLSGEPSLEQLSDLNRLESVVFRASRAIEVKSRKENMCGYILEVGDGKVMFIEIPVFAILSTYETGEANLPTRARTFPSTKFEIHFDTLNRRIRRIDCLGDNLEVEDCLPVVRQTKAFETKYPHARLVEQDWDVMKHELQKLTRGWRRPR
ncbi:MAG: hypothetical protein JW993_12370 [Sedimentisphaerales bacterium]|nr:hypothetical protein [Sedimentisphaerales bacterium]